MTMIETVKAYRNRILLTVPMIVALVATASATLNTTISDLLYGLANMFPSFVDLVVAALPVLVVIGIASFVIGFLDAILSKIKR